MIAGVWLWFIVRAWAALPGDHLTDLKNIARSGMSKISIRHEKTVSNNFSILL
jgi:hypothetical protein